MRLWIVVGLAIAATSLSPSPARASQILVSPLAFDFGDVYEGVTSSPQTVTITNVSPTTQTLSLAGGAAGQFGGNTNCPVSLAPGASCEIIYRFAPTGLGPTSTSTTLGVSGESHLFQFKGSGLDPFLVTPTSFAFGNVAIGNTSSPQTVTITNVSPSTQTLSLAGGAAGQFGGSSNCPPSLAPGASCEISYRFAPTSNGDATGTTTLGVNGSTYTFSFEGTGGTAGASPFLVSPRTFDFGGIYTGTTSAAQTVTITNVSPTTQTLSLAGGAAGQFGGNTNCPVSLAPGASCEIIYRFAPTHLGATSTSTTLGVGGVSYLFQFKGSGLDPFLVSPLSFDFGEVALGTTSVPQFVDIFNLSDVFQSLNLAGGAAGVFGGSANCSTGVDPGASCAISYAFTPSILGPVSGSTTLGVDGKTRTFSFTGIGILESVMIPGPPTLSLIGGGILVLACFRRKSRTPPKERGRST